MIQVRVKTNTARKTVNVELSDTPAKVFGDLGIGTSGSVVNLNGTICSVTDLNSSFEALGVTDGSTVDLNSIVKADGAR